MLTGSTTSPRVLLAEMWAQRELWVTLSRKEFFVRYRRASLGLFWAVGLPLLQAVVLAVVFSHIVRFTVSGSYPVFVFSGLTAWSYFSTTLSSGSTAIVDGSALSSKIYFPRALLPLVDVGAGLYGLGISLVLLIGMDLAVGSGLGLHTLYLIPGTVLTVLVATTFVLVASALHVYFRDVRYLIQAGMMVLFYLTPVFYPLGRAHGALRDVLLALPMAGPAELMHAGTGGADGPWTVAVAVTCGWTVAAAAAALYLHCRWNRVFSDLL